MMLNWTKSLQRLDNTFHTVVSNCFLKSIFNLCLQKNRETLLGLKDGFKDLRDEISKWVQEGKQHVLGGDSHLYVMQGTFYKYYQSIQNFQLCAFLVIFRGP
jgi:hypothetical protein